MCGPIGDRPRQRRAVAFAAPGQHIHRTQERIMPMEMTGEFRIPAPRAARLGGAQRSRDPETGIPGCQTIEKVSDTEITAKVVAKVGPVKATFAGKVTLSDLDPPNGYTITGEGTGGVAGFAKGGAKVALDEDGGEATVLTTGPGACRRQARADRLAPDRRDVAQDGGGFFRALRRRDRARGARPRRRPAAAGRRRRASRRRGAARSRTARRPIVKPRQRTAPLPAGCRRRSGSPGSPRSSR